MTRKLFFIALLLTALTAGARAQQEASILKQAYEARKALAIIAVTAENEVGRRNYAGQAVCIDDQAGVFMTLALPTSLKAEDITEAKLLAGADDSKGVAAKLLGIDFGTGLGFVQATEPHTFAKVTFKGSSDVAPADPVSSVGLLTNVQGFEPYVGVAYVAARLRVPEHMAVVTGGNLTGTCSPVFNAEGKAIGLVGKQLPMQYQTQTQRGRAQLNLLGVSQTRCFWPIEEFAHVLKNIPVAGKATRPSWIGVAGFTSVAPEIAEVNAITGPAVTVGRVVPEYAADKAGLKSGDIIVGIDGQKLEDLATPDLERLEFVRRIVRMPAGKPIELTIVRTGNRKRVSLETQPLPRTPNEAPRYMHRALGLLVRERVALESDMDPDAVDGIVVLATGKDSVAARAGLQPQDVIVQVNAAPVRELTKFKRVLESSIEQATKTGNWPILKVRRGESTLDVQIRP
jgi:S1-C subfamily serine protease